MVDVVVLEWDDWEGLYLDGEKQASGHRGRVDRLKHVEGDTVETYEAHRVFPEGGVYPTDLNEVLEGE
jgi:hypothetical protein